MCMSVGLRTLGNSGLCTLGCTLRAMLLEFISGICGHRHFLFQCLKTYCGVYCVCSKPSLSCRSSVSGCSAQCRWLLYNSTDYSNKGDLQCTHWHTFFLSRLPSICHYLFIPARTCFLSPKSQLFSSRSIKRSLKRFVSLCLFSLSVTASSLFVLFISVTLAASQNSQLLLTLSALLPLFPLCHCPLYHLPSICPHHLSLSFAPFLPVWAPAQILQMLLHTG